MQEFHSSSGADGFPTRRSILPNFIHLSQIGDFWKRYDALAESHDTKMYKQINSLLDVLLIFAGLFSAINTAFISLTMPALSPSPSAETNMLLRLLVSKADNSSFPLTLAQPFTPEPISVAMNGFIFASLSCSLYGALIIMFLKESLSTLDGARQPGPIENQGRFRQRKLDGVRRWHLATCISLLPYVISVSLVLFAIGVEMWLFTVNATVGAIVGVTMVVETGLAFTVITAGAIHPQCPYATAGSRALRSCWMRVWQTIRAAKKAELVKGDTRRNGSKRKPSSPNPDEGTPPFRDSPNPLDTLDSIYVEEECGDTRNQYKRQVTNFRAAFWLLEVAPSREDQVLAVQFLLTIPREAYGTFTMSPQQRRLVKASTLEAFDIWRTQPNERTQEIAEHFGRALCRVLPPTRGIPERWNESTTLTPGPRLDLGGRFLQELGVLEHNHNSSDAVGEELAFRTTLLRTLILTKDIPVDTYRWTSLKLLIRRDDEDCYLLWLWAKLVYRGFGHSLSYHIRQFPFAGVPGEGRLSRRDVTDKDFPLALACGIPALKSIERQAVPDNMASLVLDAVEIYNACVRKTSELAGANRLFPPLPGLAAEGTTEMLTYFKKSTFLNPPERRLIHFFISALQLLQSLHNSGYTPSLDTAAFDGLWYALESIISAIDSSSETDRRSMNDLVLQTLESVSDWLPVTFGAYSPMIGLEAHPRIMEYIIRRLVGEYNKSEGRAVHLMYKNRFRWFTQASSALRTAWMDASLGSHLVDALRRPDAWKDTALLVRILEDITEMSMDWSHKLVDDDFLTSVADVILNFDKVEDDNPVRRRCIQCRLTRALLSVWRHCSAVTEIKWPKEKMLLVINSASSATEWLLGRDETQVGPESSSNVALRKDAIVDIRNKLKMFFDWTTERLPQSALISGDASQAISALLIQRTDGESPPASRFRVSRTCSRESYIENSLL